MAHPLDGVQDKLDRAVVHLNALRDEHAAFNPGEFYDTIIEERAQRDKQGRIVFDGYLKILKEPSSQFGILAGDWAHNLRGGLDHLVYQLAVLDSSGKPPAGTFFPIARTESEYLAPGPCGTDSLRDRALAGIIDDHRAPIDAAQPYHKGSRQIADRQSLSILNAFANTDKHRLIHRTALRPKHIKVQPLNAQVKVEITVPAKLRNPIADGTKVYELRFSKVPPNMEVPVNTEFFYELGFGNRGLRLEDLARITFEIKAYINQFRAFWP